MFSHPMDQVRNLARLSYKLHADLAARFGAEEIGYRAVKTLQVSATASMTGQLKPPIGQDLMPSWVDGNIKSLGVRILVKQSFLVGTPSITLMLTVLAAFGKSIHHSSGPP